MALLVCGGMGIARADSVVVFNEVMYHPATNETAFEWIELHNQNAVSVDLGGWRLTGGINYTFPAGTTIRGGAQLVVSAAPAILMAATGVTNVVGPFTGRLSNDGDDVRLLDNAGRRMDSIQYGVDGDWPAGADGSGMSLAKRSPNLASGPAENWTVSREPGGTPGASNFVATTFTGARSNVTALASSWRYHDGGIDLGTAWRNPGFDDSSWASGQGLFYYEESALPGPKSTPLAPGRSTYYFRTSFNIAGDPALKLLSVRPLLDDGAVIYLNGVEVQRVNMPAGPIQYATEASASIPNAVLGAAISLPTANLVAGNNLLA
ncbi:MAG TPA: lamin tail domain-containing protein, partial [Candidatus Dormibacteraeota bacterium]|nr:lamin tail domain-containing protein [Candidatus Dormibacteraeota bacterium]